MNMTVSGRRSLCSDAGGVGRDGRLLTGKSVA